MLFFRSPNPRGLIHFESITGQEHKVLGHIVVVARRARIHCWPNGTCPEGNISFVGRTNGTRNGLIVDIVTIRLVLALLLFPIGNKMHTRG